MIWAYLKAYLRRYCTYNFVALKDMLPKAVKEIPISTFRRCAQHSYRFMSAYRLGLEGPLADYALKKYTSHRRIPENVVNELKRQYEEDLKKKDAFKKEKKHRF